MGKRCSGNTLIHNIDCLANKRILKSMSATGHKFSFDVLVELMTAHAAQSPEGTPVSRVESRLSHSLNLARKAGILDLEIWLDRNDYMWLCNARGVDRLSTVAARMMIECVPARRARQGCESHIAGVTGDDEVVCFPIIADPSLTPDFRQMIATPAEKAAMLQNFERLGKEAALVSLNPKSATRQ